MFPHPKRVCGLTGQPSPKQVEYAEAIHTALGVELPEEKTKQEYSDFINKYMKRYKQALREVII